MIISLIAAIGKRGQLGNKGKLPWRIPQELAHFKKYTSGRHLLMGRKTFESLPSELPDRTIIILTNNNNFGSGKHLIVSSIDEALELAKERQEEELFVCGGGEIYSQTITRADRLYISTIEWDGEADTFFPPFKQEKWQITKTESHIGWQFNLYQRLK